MTRHRRTRSRAGIVLVMVLVVVAMLALGAYSFARLMNLEGEAANSYGRLVQAREAAASGVAYTAAILADQKRSGALGTDLSDSPALFQNQPVSDPSRPTLPVCGFSLVMPRDDDSTARSWRYGVSDEASRLNLNALAGWMKPPSSSQAGSGSGGGDRSGTGGGQQDAAADSAVSNPLLNLPNMTPEIADAILDWIDADDEPRESGAESDYYQSLDPPYRAKNGPIDSLDELLLVRGVTPRLLYGEDANRNGMLDANENDRDQSYPMDDGDGKLDRGWLPFLTLHSHESNNDASGNARINLNGQDLQSLYDQLSADADFGADKAQFIVAFRLFGPASNQPEGSGGGSGASASGDGSGRADSGPGGASSGAAASGANGAAASGATGSSTSSGKTIAGMDASGGAKQQLESVVELIGATVQAKMQGRDQTTELRSPFRDDELDGFLETLLDRTATSDAKDLAGRINVNTAPREVLLGIPSMTSELADAIVAARTQPAGTSGGSFAGGTAWLLGSTTMTKDQFKKFDRYLTGRSQVFRVQAVGYFQERGPVARVEAVIDVTGSTPLIRSWTDLSMLGRGYDPVSLNSR